MPRKKKQEEPYVICTDCGAEVLYSNLFKDKRGFPLCEDCFRQRNIPAPDYDPKDVAFYPETHDEFFKQVDQIVNSDRQADYGDGLERMRVAGGINDLLFDIIPSGVSTQQLHIITMLCEKLTRAACNPHKADTWLDIAGYARFGYHAARQ